ncbi:DUF4363 family protein [Ruminococcus albus]|uniref:DUF4363 domain-containing protein n=1 Tax=Ruminococcus albus (strain ATCC 27210 / DSM 20455 / JCM 14654 / NCDO 2250 / 7) TaxID=697329 RepID=E6UJ75_RUMA7|nr:DUF4363 family protein [Ruminococcus albus]ADU23423.1 hypothetical protein Rumal_2957 [Ruminococcus albus 7 = DSM 20455]
MKRLVISILLLTLILAAGISSAVYVNSFDKSIQLLCSKIRAEAVMGEDTVNDTAKLCSMWGSHSKVLAFIDNSSNVTAVSAEISKLPALAETGSEDLIVQIDNVSELCRRLSERQILHIRSLL